MNQSQNTQQLQPKITKQKFVNQLNKLNYTGKRPSVLLILDGWGIGPDYEGNAITKAKTPSLDRLWLSFPHTQLEASGKSVGLPHMVDGNSETGHLNIGAGSIIYQDLPRINNAIADGSFFQNKSFHRAFDHVKKHNSVLHLMGLIGQGFVHSNIEHLYALLHLAKKNNVQKVYIHGFTDGRDSPPNVGISLVSEIMEKCKQLGIGELATLVGRYYAMDRDKRWERIEKAYNALTIGSGSCTQDPLSVMQQFYDKGISDEFIEPINVCDEEGKAKIINDNDAVIFYNFRVDRPRELTRAFVLPDFEQGIKKEDYDPYYEKYHKTHLKDKDEEKMGTTFKRQRVINNLYFVTMTTYEKVIPADVAFAMQDIRDNIGSIFSGYGFNQLRVTENEKERMITYYMNGQRKQPYSGETWMIYPSKGSKSYADVPEMSAFEIADAIIKGVQTNQYDSIISNIANGDMVGHTGSLEAAIRACEIVDKVVGMIVDAVLAQDGIVFITADHGNVEEMINMQTGQPDTEHSIYPVPFIIANKDYLGNPRTLRSGILADIVPTMLHLMGLSKPEGMMGRVLM